MSHPESSAPGCPFSQGENIAPYDKEQITYNDYLQVPTLLSLQKPQSDPPHHDEYLFIIIHQSYELWFKLILHELTKTGDFFKENNLLRALHYSKRAGEIIKMLVPQIHMLETMMPVDFLYFRDRLNPASGFQSIQFRELEFLMGLKNDSYLQFFDNRPDLKKSLQKRLEEPSLRDIFYQMLSRIGLDIPENVDVGYLEEHPQERQRLLQSLLTLYKKPEDNMALYLVAESLMDFDQYLSLWRDHHVRVVSRIIGEKIGTGGSSGVRYLQSTTSKKCFPYLWQVRTLLMKE